MQFITLLLTVAFVFRPQVSRCAPLTADTHVASTRSTTQLAEKHHHPYIGYDPTGHHATSRIAEQKHVRRGPAVPPTRHTEPERPVNLPLIRRAPRPIPVMFPPTVKHAQTVQNVYKPLQHPGSNPIRRPAPIPRPAIFASSLHPHVQIAKSPIQRPPSPAGHPGGYVHDIQKSSRWGPQHHTGVKGPGVRPY